MNGTRSARCNCGAVRITTRGELLRVAICHCTVCRREGGGAFAVIPIWRDGDVTIEGETASWTATTDARHFCPVCGSTMFSVAPGSGEIEVRLGAFDPGSGLVPAYENWVVHREPWLPVLAGEQHDGNRRADDRDLLVWGSARVLASCRNVPGRISDSEPAPPPHRHGRCAAHFRRLRTGPGGQPLSHLATSHKDRAN
jgi:hypothetical protein